MSARVAQRGAARVLGALDARISEFGSDMIKLREEIEAIYEEMRKTKSVTKEVIERIKEVRRKFEETEAERREHGGAFPVFDVMRDYFLDARVPKVSQGIFEELEKRKLLSKESFLKKAQKKEIKRVIREHVINNYGLVDEID
ncbi:MAG: hypothetical protein QFX35_01030 [Candidatus Verstraetearchaeota archaeon]|nr:hypothetical protein [Candidatus Verstraetearchaeota archaeon]